MQKLLIMTVIMTCTVLASCNVTRSITNESQYYQRGDTSVVIQTKTIETYDASKKLQKITVFYVYVRSALRVFTSFGGEDAATEAAVKFTLKDAYEGADSQALHAQTILMN